MSPKQKNEKKKIKKYFEDWTRWQAGENGRQPRPCIFCVSNFLLPLGQHIFRQLARLLMPVPLPFSPSFIPFFRVSIRLNCPKIGKLVSLISLTNPYCHKVFFQTENYQIIRIGFPRFGKSLVFQHLTNKTDNRYRQLKNQFFQQNQLSILSIFGWVWGTISL